MRRLAVIPGSPIETYLKKGFTLEYLRDYYNPGNFFDEVYILSPWEEKNQKLSTMKIIKIRSKYLFQMIK